MTGAERLRELLAKNGEDIATVQLAVFTVKPPKSALALAKELVVALAEKRLLSLNEAAQSDLVYELCLALRTQTAEFQNPASKLHVILAHR